MSTTCTLTHRVRFQPVGSPEVLSVTVVAAPPQEEEEGFPMRMVRGMGVPGVDADVPGDVICREGASPTHPARSPSTFTSAELVLGDTDSAAISTCALVSRKV